MCHGIGFRCAMYCVLDLTYLVSSCVIYSDGWMETINLMDTMDVRTNFQPNTTKCISSLTLKFSMKNVQLDHSDCSQDQHLFFLR